MQRGRHQRQRDVGGRRQRERCITVWDMKAPGWARQGLLPIDTTRGDRVFMGLLLTGCTFCLWLYFFSQTAVWGVVVIGALLMMGTINFF